MLKFETYISFFDVYHLSCPAPPAVLGTRKIFACEGLGGESQLGLDEHARHNKLWRRWFLGYRYLLFVLSLENDAFILVVVLAVSKKWTFSKLIRSLKHNSNIDFLGVWVSGCLSVCDIFHFLLMHLSGFGSCLTTEKSYNYYKHKNWNLDNSFTTAAQGNGVKAKKLSDNGGSSGSSGSLECIPSVQLLTQYRMDG